MTFRTILATIMFIVALYEFTADWPVGILLTVGGIFVLLPVRRTTHQTPPPPQQRTQPPPAQSPPQPVPPQSAQEQTAPAPLPPRPPAAQNRETARRTIVTRTTNNTGAPLYDPYAHREREWEPDEDLDLLELYSEEKAADTNRNATRDALANLAGRMSIDQRQVAIRLIRLLLNPEGDIDDVENAQNDGRRYQKGERVRMVTLYSNGTSLRHIAEQFERTQLGVGWQLLNHKLYPVKVPPELLARYRAECADGTQ